jgi:uncharacterized Zn-binding protein involved in type VI secretion
MPQISRIGDIGAGLCMVVPPHYNFGVLVTGSSNVLTEGSNTSRLGDIIVNFCHGVIGTMISSSSTVNVNGRGVVRVGDAFTGMFIGNLISGASRSFAGG